MKFLCDRCKTRYSIGDDRVRGKILKIRCKNCANVITVREGMTADGSDLPPRAKKPTTMAPAPVDAGASATGSNSALNQAFASAMTKPPPALEEEWYVSIDGEQAGPFNLTEAQRWVGSKPHDADLHCWSEGFDDWLPVDKVSHFRGLRKKPMAPPPLPRGGTGPSPVRPVGGTGPQGVQQRVEEEPKPLFAATMATLEKASAPVDTARGVGLGNGTGAAQMPKGPVVPTGPNGVLQAKNGPPGGRAAKPIFDADDGADGATVMEPVPFGGEAMTTPEPIASAAKTAKAMDDAPTMTPGNAPIPLSALAGSGASTPAKPATPSPLGGPSTMSPFSGNPGGMFGGPTSPSTPTGGPLGTGPMGGATNGPMTSAPPAADAESSDGAVDGDGLDIGEVSRVVKLADLVRGGGRTGPNQAMRRSNPGLNQTGAVGRMSGPAPRIAGTGAAPAITTPGVNPEQLIGPDGLPVPLPLGDEGSPDQLPQVHANAPISHKRGMLMLIGGAVALIGILLVVVLIVNQGDDEPPPYVAQYTEIDTTGREIIITVNADGTTTAIDKKTGARVDPPPRKPPAGSARPPLIPTKPPDPALGDPLGGGDIEAMAAKNSRMTATCWQRSRKGAEDIILSDVKKITVVLTIDKTGSVTNVQYKGLPSGTKLETCLTNSIKVAWKFRANPGTTLGFTMVPPT